MLEREEGAGPTGAAAPRDRTLRRWLLVAIAVLYVFSIPWYRSTDAPLRLVFGLPDWVFTALACYVAAAVLNAWAWWIADIRDDETGEAGSVAGRAPGPNDPRSEASS